MSPALPHSIHFRSLKGTNLHYTIETVAIPTGHSYPKTRRASAKFLLPSNNLTWFPNYKKEKKKNPHRSENINKT